MMKLMVKLKEYQAAWKEKYDFEKNRIQHAIGDRLLGIEHIGSTSIEGMTAKPIIDILVGIDQLNRMEVIVESLHKVEYEYVPKPEFPDRLFFRKGLWGQGTCHLHICKYDEKEWVEKLLFRDYLRLHPKAAKEYELLKRRLAKQFPDDHHAYTQAKEPFIHAIIQKAREQI